MTGRVGTRAPGVPTVTPRLVRGVQRIRDYHAALLELRLGGDLVVAACQEIHACAGMTPGISPQGYTRPCDSIDRPVLVGARMSDEIRTAERAASMVVCRVEICSNT